MDIDGDGFLIAYSYGKCMLCFRFDALKMEHYWQFRRACYGNIGHLRATCAHCLSSIMVVHSLVNSCLRNLYVFAIRFHQSKGIFD